MVDHRMSDRVVQIRQEFEKGTISQELLKDLYKNYHQMSNIESFIKKAQKLFPKGNCGIASCYLQHKLRRGTIVSAQYKENNHTVLLLGDATIIDITADQYGGPPAYIGKIKEPYKINL